MNRRLLSALLFVGAGCATTQGAGNTQAAETQHRERLINRSEFDVAICQAPSPGPSVSTEETVTGVLANTRPFVLECLVNPKARGPEKETTVVLDTVVTDAGAQHQVSGTNLTPEGAACVEDVLARTVQLPALGKGAQPVKGQVQIMHLANVSPTVIWGNNEASDVVGAIRMAQPTWCDCYANHTAAPPMTVRAWLRVFKDTTSISEVVWVPLSDTEPPALLLRAKKDEKPAEQALAAAALSPEEEKLTGCLTRKLQQLQLAAAPTEDKVLPYTFESIHSNAVDAAPNASPELRFRHLDAVRATQQASAVIANGVWMAAANQFVDLATRYNQMDRKVTYKQVKEQCGARLNASNAWLAFMDKQLDVEKKQMALAEGEAAKDASWAEAVTKAAEQAAKTEADRAQVQKYRDEDAALCKKL